EQGGGYWITETQKETARVHAIDRSLLKGLWSQGKSKSVARNGRILNTAGSDSLSGDHEITWSGWTSGPGLTVELWFEPSDSATDACLFEAKAVDGSGVFLSFTPDK